MGWDVSIGLSALSPSAFWKTKTDLFLDRRSGPFSQGGNADALGGGDGAPGAVYLDDGTPFPTKGRELVPAGRRLIMELPGGGGFGDPADRDPDAVANDIAQGYVTEDHTAG